MNINIFNGYQSTATIITIIATTVAVVATLLRTAIAATIVVTTLLRTVTATTVAVVTATALVSAVLWALGIRALQASSESFRTEAAFFIATTSIAIE